MSTKKETKESDSKCRRVFAVYFEDGNYILDTGLTTSCLLRGDRFTFADDDSLVTFKVNDLILFN